MKYEDLKKILYKFNITSLEQLEEQLTYYLNTLSSNYDECGDDPIDKDCTNSNCYEDLYVPDCRKLIEIYNKYFKKEISNRKYFIEYLVKFTNTNKSSVENYLYCRSCNQQIRKGTKASLKIPNLEFKKNFCKNLSIKFDYKSLFETEYTSINQFLIKEHSITNETFTPIYNQNNTITKDEENKLFELVYTSKEQFQKNLIIEENLIGTETYLFNLASYAFDRGLYDESISILNKLDKKSNSNIVKVEFLKLKAKILSNKNQDKEAILILKEIISENKSNVEPEIYNLLAASIKRDSLNEFNLYNDEQLLIEKLNEAKTIYYSVYNLTKDYYPAINYIYLNFMLAHINNQNLEIIIDEAKNIWSKSNHKINDWWSFISNVEYLTLIEQYKDAKHQLNMHFSELNKEYITDFNISSTLRQLNLYYKYFCKDLELKEIIDYIKDLNQSSI